MVANAAACDCSCGSRWAYLERMVETKGRKDGLGVKVEGAMGVVGGEVRVPKEREAVGGLVGSRLSVLVCGLLGVGVGWMYICGFSFNVETARRIIVCGDLFDRFMLRNVCDKVADLESNIFES